MTTQKNLTTSHMHNLLIKQSVCFDNNGEHIIEVYNPSIYSFIEPEIYGNYAIDNDRYLRERTVETYINMEHREYDLINKLRNTIDMLHAKSGKSYFNLVPEIQHIHNLINEYTDSLSISNFNIEIKGQ